MPERARILLAGVALPAFALALAALPACGADVGSLFSSSGVDAGSGSSGAPSSAGADALGGAGSSSAGESSGGSASAAGGDDASAGESDVGGSAQGGRAPSGGAGGGGGGMPSGAGAGGAPAPSVCDSKLVSPEATVATFENGVAGWSAYLDGNPFGLDSAQPGANSSERALRFQGGKANTSGVYRLLPCSNVSAYDGIEFWGKGKGEMVRFLAVIPATDPTPEVGDCREPEQKCSDHPGLLFSFSEQWQLYRAPFASLKQYGWGTKASFGSVLNAVLWINDGPVEHFEFSIDEVRLYKTAPTL